MHPRSSSSRSRLTPHHLPEFAGDTLFDSVAREVCNAQCLPRKELEESWAVARKVLRKHRGGPVVDLAGGHGLVAFLVLLQDRSTPNATVIDTKVPKSAHRLHEALATRWPAVAARWTFVEADLRTAVVDAGTRILGIHACGALTDHILDIAIDAGARVAVLPCCHSTAKLDDGELSGWLPTDVAIDATRASRLRDAGYAVHTTTIDAAITPKNRLLLGQKRAVHTTDVPRIEQS